MKKNRASFHLAIPVNALAERVREAGITFVIEPYIRFEGLACEQATMFFKDPSANALEFKAFSDIDQLFAKERPAAPSIGITFAGQEHNLFS